MIKNKYKIENKDFLYKQLIRLGDMMGDGLHLEPDGKWIEQEYANILRLLGLSYPKAKKKKRTNTKKINEYMKDRINKVNCSCGGKLKQTRSGSFVGKCVVCDKKYRLGKIK